MSVDQAVEQLNTLGFDVTRTGTRFIIRKRTNGAEPLTLAAGNTNNLVKTAIILQRLAHRLQSRQQQVRV